MNSKGADKLRRPTSERRPVQLDCSVVIAQNEPEFRLEMKRIVSTMIQSGSCCRSRTESRTEAVFWLALPCEDGDGAE